MELAKKEQQMTTDPRKNIYAVPVKRDKKLMLDFIKFETRVRHPRVTMNMVILGIAFLYLPARIGEMGFWGKVISGIMGVLLILMALFRKYLSLNMMLGNPEVKENEELTYLFGNSGIRVQKDGKVEEMGYYKDVYRVWESEAHYYIGMNEEDLLILPMNRFREGDAETFKAFILDKTGADYRWQPVRFMNIIKLSVKGIHKFMSEFNLNQMRENRKKDKK